jgi:hypothetical protein
MPIRLGLLAAALLLAGCGSTHVAADPPERVASPRTLRAAAKPVCEQLQRRIARLKVPDRADDPRLLLGLADAWAETVRDLRRLHPPARERARFRRMLMHFERTIRAARAVPTAEDELALAAVVGLLDQGGKGATIAQSLGLGDCSVFPPEPTKQELAEVRRQFAEQVAKVPPLDQAADLPRIGPRVKTPARP